MRQALAEALCRESAKRANGESSCMGVLEKTMDRLNDILAGTFPGQSVVVKDQVLGYRRKKDMFVLLVEVFGPDDSERAGARTWSRSARRSGSSGRSRAGTAAGRRG